MGHPVFIMRIDTHLRLIYNKGNPFRTIKASGTLKHQPTAWNVHSHITQVVAAMGNCFCIITPHQHSIAESRAFCSLPFTTKTRAKHPFIKAPAPYNTFGSCWLCVRHLTDCGFVFECHFHLLFVNSFQLVTKEKYFSSRI